MPNTTHALLKTESLWLEIKQQNSKTKLIVGVIYRHPDQSTITEFLDCFSNCLTKLSSSKQIYYLICDFNIDLKKKSRSNSAKNYIDTLIANGAVPLITIPTRVTDKTSTIIDHVITNDVKHHISPAVLEVNLTDHYPILCAVKQSKPMRKVKVSESFYRDQSKFVADSFCEDLQNKLHDYFVQQPSLCNSNYNSLFNKFASIVTETIDIHAPLTKL